MRKLFFSGIVLLALVTGIFWKTLFLNSAGIVFHHVLSQKLDAKITFEKIDFTGSFVLEGVQFLSNKGKKNFGYAFKAKQIKIHPYFSFKDYKLHIDLDVKIPDVVVLKKKDASLISHQKKSSFVQWHVSVDKGTLHLFDKGQKIIDASFSSQREFNEWVLSFDQASSLRFHFVKDGKDQLIDIQAETVCLKKLLALSQFFHLPHSQSISMLQGSFSGFSQIAFRKQNSLYLKGEIDDFVTQNTTFSIGAEKAFLEIESPVQSPQKKGWIADLFFIHDSRIILSFKEGFFGSVHQNPFTHLSGRLSYNPGVGPKGHFWGETSEKMPFELSARGFFQSKFSNWIDLNVTFPDASLSVKAQEKEEKLDLVCTFQDISDREILSFQDFLNEIFPETQKYFFQKGILNGSLEFAYKDQKFHSLTVNHFTAQDFSLHLPEISISSCFKKIEGSFFFEKDQILDSLTSEMKFEEGSVWVKVFEKEDVSISHLNSYLQIVKGDVSSSYVDLMINGLQNHIELSKDLKNIYASSQFSGNMQGLSSYLKEGMDTSFLQNDCKGTISYQKKGEAAYLLGEVALQQEEYSDSILFGMDFQKFDLFFKKDPIKFIERGWFKTAGVQLQNYSRFLKPFQMEVEGTLDLSAFYEHEKWVFLLQEKDLILRTKHFHFIDKTEKLKDLKFVFNVPQNTWDMDCNLENACLYLPHYDLLFENVFALAEMRSNFLHSEIFSTHSKQVSFQGDVFIDFRKNLKLDIVTKSIQADTQPLKDFISHFGLDINIDLQGHVKSEENGFYLSTTFQNDTKWGFQAVLEKSFYLLTNHCFLQNVEADLFFDSDQNLFSITDLSGDVLLENGEKKNTYQISLPFFSMECKKSFVFDLRLQKPMWDVLRLKGEGGYQDEKIHLAFDPLVSEFFLSPLNVHELVLNHDFSLHRLKMEPKLYLPQLLPKLEFLSNMHGIPSQNIDEVRCDLEGEIDISVLVSDENANIDMQTSSLSLNGKTFEKGALHAKKEKGGWNISHLSLDEFIGSLFLETEKKSFSVSQCHGQYKEALFADMEIFYLGGGKFSSNIHNLVCELEQINEWMPVSHMTGSFTGTGCVIFQMPFFEPFWKWEVDLDLDPAKMSYKNTNLQNNSPTHFFYSSEEGFMATKMDLDVQNTNLGLPFFNFCVDNIKFQDSSWQLENAHFFVSDDLYSFLRCSLNHDELDPLLNFLNQSFPLDKNIEINADIGFCFGDSSFWFDLKEAFLPINGERRHIKDLFFEWSSQFCKWEFSFCHQDYFMRTKGDIDLDNLKGTLSFQEEAFKEADPLTFLWAWEEGIIFKNIQGSFCGLEASFYEEGPQSLCGGLKVNFHRLKDLLPSKLKQTIEHFKMGSGYEIRGHLFLDVMKKDFQLKGILSGKNFELLGYEFKTLMANIEHSPQNFLLLKDLKISDNAGIVKIDHILSSLHQNRRKLEISKIQLNEFRPSLLKEVGKDLSEMDPLLVRNMEIESFEGFLDDSNSFQAKGSLNFINSFKRGYSVFDIPSDILGRIFGLDLELLIPVKGRVNFKVQDSKITLTDLIDSYSENQHSKFFLFEKDISPHMDFDGNLNINVKMKQYVLFKFTEHFIITIKGTLKNPKFNLKHKQSFF